MRRTWLRRSSVSRARWSARRRSRRATSRPTCVFGGACPAYSKTPSTRLPRSAGAVCSMTMLFRRASLYLSPMRVSIICVGRPHSRVHGGLAPLRSLVRPYVNLEVFEAPETPLKLGDGQARAKEGTALLGLLRKGAFTVALDGRGEEYSSEAWSGLLAGKKVDGCSHFQFVLGGASGLDQRVLGAADLRWSLSPLTFPHQMARCIVLEQLYRSLRIERGEPYHH